MSRGQNGTERKVLCISFSSIFIAKVKFTLDEQTDRRRTDRVIPIYMYPQKLCLRGV